MKILTPKFYLSFGLVSLLISVLLLAVFLGLIPDRRGEIHSQRAILSEAIASGNSLFLQKNDFGSIRSNLEFSVGRNPDLLYASVKRYSDQSTIAFGDERVASDGVESQEMTVPLFRGERQWGLVSFYYQPLAGKGWLERIQRSTLLQVLFIISLSFVGFYFYLGKMLKQLNPSSAVPARVRSALDTIAESLIVINRKSEIVLANTAFAELVQKTPDSLIGRSATTFEWEMPEETGIDDDSAQLAFPWERTLETAVAIRGEMLWMQDAQGVRRKFIVNCSPVGGGSGRTGGVLISLDDVTLLEHKEVELMRSKEDAESANRAKSEFLSNMSHEIRTPITAILGFTEVLKRGYAQDEEAAQKHLSTIGRSGKHLLELINDILDLSKVESGALSVESIECEPHLLIHDVIQVLRVKAEEKSIYLRHEIPEQLPAHIYSDPSRLRQIVTNLAGNAIKFTESGGVSVVLRVVDKGDHQQLAIDVSDTGIGMSEQQVAGIFEAFVQADTTITRRFGGTGLGLSISRKLAQALGGDITVTSSPGQGSTFTALVDAGDLSAVERLSAEQIRAATSAVETITKKHWVFTDKTVLIVDDAQENRDLLQLLLADLNLKTVLAENGKLGVEAAERESIDLVLMDIQMPVMDGYQAAAALRANGYQAPVVALTANAMKGFEDKLEQSGFSHYMTKPIDIDKLTQLLATLLDGQSVSPVVADHEVVGESAEIAGSNTSSPPEMDAAELTAAPIYNTLVLQNEKFRPIAERFLSRLTDRLDELEEAANAADASTVASLAHWLKGSGGSVGFRELTEPAAELEQAAKDQECDRFTGLVAALRALSVRLTLEQDSGESVRVLSISEDLGSRADDGGADADSPIISRLIDKGPQFLALVQRFVPRLEENLSVMESAVDIRDYETIASLAHWLKGSGGNVGFHVFTSPASELESAAKNQDNGEIDRLFTKIRGLARRIVPPDDTAQISATA